MSAVHVPADVAGAARRVHRALGTGAQSGAVGDIRWVVAWVIDLLDAEPAGSVRVEWGVEQDDGAGGRIVRGPASPDQPQSFLDDIVRSGVGNPVPVWRVVTDGGWRTGPAPEVSDAG